MARNSIVCEKCGPDTKARYSKIRVNDGNMMNYWCHNCNSKLGLKKILKKVEVVEIG